MAGKRKRWHYRAPTAPPAGYVPLALLDPLGHGHNVFSILLERKMAASAKARETKAAAAALRRAVEHRDMRIAAEALREAAQAKADEEADEHDRLIRRECRAAGALWARYVG